MCLVVVASACPPSLGQQDKGSAADGGTQDKYAIRLSYWAYAVRYAAANDLLVIRPAAMRQAANVGNGAHGRSLVVAVVAHSRCRDVLRTFPTLARKLKACHLMRRWGLPCATTWRTHIAPRGAMWHVSGTVAAHRTHRRAFEGHVPV
jgi:hypothetical protein